MRGDPRTRPGKLPTAYNRVVLTSSIQNSCPPRENVLIAPVRVSVPR